MSAVKINTLELENVKQDTLLNSAVDEAVLERIEKLRAKIEELNFDMVCYEKEISAMIEYHNKYMNTVNTPHSGSNIKEDVSYGN